MSETTKILDNIIWLVNAFDDDALGKIHDIPLLEMAKVVTISPLSLDFTASSQVREKRTPPRYSTNKIRS